MLNTRASIAVTVLARTAVAARFAGQRRALAEAGFAKLYRDHVQRGTLRPDTTQAMAAQHLHELEERVLAWQQRMSSAPVAAARKPPQRTASWFGALLGGGAEPDAAEAGALDPPAGLYMWGGVGCGKTHLMDMFFEHVAVGPKKRVSFHSFMLDVHGRLHAWKRSAPPGSEHRMLPDVAAALAREAWLLCFDEFQVTDIANAMIMRQLFSAMFARGVVMVATSNRAPDELYLQGLQRQNFLPFIELLKQRTRVLHLASDTDYRKLFTQAAGAYDPKQTYFFPASDSLVKAHAAKLFADAIGDRAPRPRTLQVMMGRTLRVDSAAAGVARFSFDALCKQPVFSADYLALCASYHTIFVDDVPVMSMDDRNSLRRFITLVDHLYEEKRKLVVLAAAPIHKLFAGQRTVFTPGRDDVRSTQPKRVQYAEDEAFAFDRTLSRIIEMRSHEYLDAHAKLVAARSWDD